MKIFVLAFILTCIIFPSLASADALEEMNNETYKPQLSYGFKEESTPWTSWNKFWLSSAIVGQTGDIVSTYDATENGTCVELNPIFGEDPDMGLIILVKGLLLGGAYVLTEHVYQGTDAGRQDFRNNIYATLGIVGGIATVHNISQDCN